MTRAKTKKLIILRATYFASETPGNVRIKNFAKYLAVAGYDVTVAMLSKGAKGENALVQQDGYSLSLAYIPSWLNLFVRFFDYAVWRFLGYPHNWCLRSRILQRHVTKNFNILYTGVLAGGRNPESLLCALDKLMSQGFDLNGVKLVFVGITSESAKQFERHKCYAHIHALGWKSRAECLALQREAGLLVSLASPGCAGILTSKVFDYANAGRPVISVPCDHDALDEFIMKAGIGASFETVDEMAEYIKEQIVAWRNGLPAVGYKPNRRYLESFSRKNQATRLAEMIAQRFFNG